MILNSLILFPFFFVIYTISKKLFGTKYNILNVFSFTWYSVLLFVFLNPLNYIELSIASTILFLMTPIIISFGALSTSIFIKKKKVIKIISQTELIKINIMEKKIILVL